MAAATDMFSARKRKALIIGGGPVGALTALSLHRRGWSVELWEARKGLPFQLHTRPPPAHRSDPRGIDGKITNLRSINLAISSRGLEAIRSVDPSLAEQFLGEAISMKGRMIHTVDGGEESQIYDPVNNQCINSISRPILNQRLIEALPKEINTRFNTKISHIDFEQCEAFGVTRNDDHPIKSKVVGQEDNDGRMGGNARDYGKRVKEKEKMSEDEEGTAFDLVIGCDGSWSKVRQEMMRVERLDFSQSFIPHAYIELHMPADLSKPGGFAIDKNHLHIWPRHSFMLIALPNKDGSFTLTLFMPFASLETLNSRDAARSFFNENFPSAVKIVGEDLLLDDFEKNPRGNLVTINVSPSSWSSHALLLGDSSHSMVPFYGQGLNCGLEDVRVLNSYLEKYVISPMTTSPPGVADTVLATALAEYAKDRHDDLQAICELALENYTEMRSTVLSPMYHFRRHLDTLFTSLFPSHPKSELSLTNPFPTSRVRGWTSLYEMVTFRPDVGYAEALRKEKWQKEVVGAAGWLLGGGLVAGLGVVAWFSSRSGILGRISRDGFR